MPYFRTDFWTRSIYKEVAYVLQRINNIKDDIILTQHETFEPNKLLGVGIHQTGQWN